MAHVPELPGCMARGGDRAVALATLPETIDAYYEWLRRHGEKVEMPSGAIRFKVAAVSSETGPFDPGDVSALFEWEREPLTRQALNRMLQLATYNRADLLALVRPLSSSVRKWQADPDSMSIEQVLRHICNGDRWYVSRIVPAETLPAQWSDDAEISLSRYLKMIRTTAAARLRQFSDEELSGVFYPTQFTQKPGEAWTARKVMRRLLEHEREHAAHIREILREWRQHLLARLAAERAVLLWQLRGLDEETVCHQPVSQGWTAKDLLAHVGHWDAVHTERMANVKDGRIGDVQPVGGAEEMDELNAELHERDKSVPLEQVVASCLKERNDYLAMLAKIPDALWHGQVNMPWGWRTRMRVWTSWRHRHDAAHAKDLVAWRKRLPGDLKGNTGPKSMLRAIIKATREEFISLAELVHQSERDVRPLCGVWTLKDLVGHLTDWELIGVDGLAQMLAGQVPEFDPVVADILKFNDVKAAARSDQAWDSVWSEFLDARMTLVGLADRLSDDDLARTYPTPWGATISVYQWMLIWSGHERTCGSHFVRRACRSVFSSYPR
jgi:uncharacterized damage-inducible protein DinB/predicted RNase H-like HicB family nuclease